MCFLITLILKLIYFRISNKRRTKYIPNTIEPEWNERIDYLISSDEFSSHYLELTLCDYDKYNKNICLGRVLVSLNGLLYILKRLIILIYIFIINDNLVCTFWSIFFKLVIIFFIIHFSYFIYLFQKNYKYNTKNKNKLNNKYIINRAQLVDLSCVAPD